MLPSPPVCTVCARRCVDGRLQETQTAIVYQPEDSQLTDAIKGGDYRLLMQFKCAHAAPASGNRPGFDLLLVRRPAVFPSTPQPAPCVVEQPMQMRKWNRGSEPSLHGGD